jgi:HD-GYP domain-containing protein (c-di-GMP phosphodiesterase class II)
VSIARRPVLPELVSGLALAIDVAVGHPIEQGLGACLVADRLAEDLQLSRAERETLFYLTLLRHIGCTTDNSDLAKAFGDEVRLAGALGPLTGGSAAEYLAVMARFAVAAKPPVAAARAAARAMLGMQAFAGLTSAICEVATRLAERTGLPEQAVAQIGMVYERWGGRGVPARRPGHELPPPVRVAQVADLAAGLVDLGHDDPLAVVIGRSGHAFDPDVVGALRRRWPDVLDRLNSASRWAAVAGVWPPAAPMDEVAVERALGAVADFVDLESPWLAGHSRGVAALACAAGERMGLGGADCVRVRHAGLLHDLGCIAVTSAIWDKPGPLTAGEWEAVRLHPYHAACVLDRSPFLAGLAAVAADHHERLAGSGYPRGVGMPQLTPEARVLAAADVYHALREARPHLPAHDAATATRALRQAVRSGGLDGDAAEAVLGAAGQPVGRRTVRASGLTAREADVLRLVARGRSTRDVARELGI